MNQSKKILAICGSTRKASVNLTLLKIITELSRETLDISIFEGLAGIPHFNPDLDNEMPPEAVTAFRRLLKEADGILICTPEYAMGVPGTLKNAIDWVVSSCELSHKPVALITASSQGFKGHASLLETLRIIECNITDEMQMVIPFVKTKIRDNSITDRKTAEEINYLLSAFTHALNHEHKAL
jgi:chromate reductase, NAD(P)H dehydrogenase (quinone)